MSSFGLAINRAELERIVLLSSLLFLAALLLVMGRTARDALFLTRFPVTWIAPVWITYGAVSAIVALGYERAVRRLPRRPVHRRSMDFGRFFKRSDSSPLRHGSCRGSFESGTSNLRNRSTTHELRMTERQKVW